MDAYQGFAAVYDAFMDNVPYGQWCQYLVGLLREYQVEGGLVLDLGCGTGSLTQLLASQGYDMIGVDNSAEMLQVALEKREESGLDILYLNQDMREFELFGTVEAVVSICDSMNYMLSYQDLKQVFSLVNNYLEPGGIFIFDLNTVYKYQHVLGDSTFAEDREDCSFIWENYYDEEEMVNEYDLAIFLCQGGDIYRKYVETHYQKAYPLSQVKQALEEAGLEFLAAYDECTRNPAREDSQRIYVVARERGKAGRYPGQVSASRGKRMGSDHQMGG